MSLRILIVRFRLLVAESQSTAGSDALLKPYEHLASLFEQKLQRPRF